MSSKSVRNPTVLDVAERAEVSVGTVSNVLNGRGNVSEARKERVQAAMRDLGFLPNGSAQSLRRQQSRVIGLCTPLTTSAYFAALLEYFEEVAANEGYAVMQVLSRGDPKLELTRVEALLGRNIDGLILIPTHDSTATLDLLALRGTPTVIVDRVTNDKRFDYVAIDDRKAMCEATEHLIGMGHRRLLYLIRDKRLPTTKLRIKGYRDATDGAKVDVIANIVQRDPGDAEFAQQIAEIMFGTQPPTAIIASNSLVALSLVQILQKLRICWPDDVALLAFDEPVWAPILSPPLSVVRHPTKEIALEAWNRLLARVRTPGLRPKRITLQAKLAPTASLGRPKANA
jgi:LacI family transcriptional regulator